MSWQEKLAESERKNQALTIQIVELRRRDQMLRQAVQRYLYGKAENRERDFIDLKSIFDEQHSSRR